MDVIGTDEIDQYVLEIAHIFIKLDASVWIAKNGYRTPGVFSELKICGSAGYKERWGWRAHPPGKWADLRVENEQKYAAQCALDAREYYKQSRGFYPS